MKSYNLFLLLAVALCFVCCQDNNDYRESYVGIYECTKSTISFEDENFRTPIDDIEIEVIPDTDSLISIDGIQLLIQDDGSTGRINSSHTAYNLVIEGSSFRLSTTPNVPGFPATCYILGDKN